MMMSMVPVRIVKGPPIIAKILFEEMPGCDQVYEDHLLSKCITHFFSILSLFWRFLCAFLSVLFVRTNQSDHLVPPRRWGSFRQ